MPNAFERHLAKLRAQCPPMPIPPGSERLPIASTTWGDAGPRVLLVHGGLQGGIGGAPESFDRQASLAAEGFRVTRVERPGFGRSPSRGPDDMERDAEWIADLLEPGTHLVGHSWGGAEALLAAARRPGAVRSLVLVEPALNGMLGGNLQWRDRPWGLLGMAAMIAGMMRASTPATLAIAFASQLGPDERGGPSPTAALRSQPALAASLGAAFILSHPAPGDALTSAAETIRRAKLPTLVITGGWSGQYDTLGRMGARLTGGRFVVVRSPNHFVQRASAQDFNRTVSAFFRASEQERR